MKRGQEQFRGLDLTFNITQDCNLRCRYCYEINKKPLDLPLEYAYDFIDIILDDPDPIAVKGTKDAWMADDPATVLDFIGGDALMRPDMVDSILKYWMLATLERGSPRARRWRASISTNATLFGDPKVKARLEKYIDTMSIGASIDGCPEVHNYNRSNSMPAILKTWDWYRDYCRRKAARVSTKSTLNADSIPYLSKSLRFMYEEMGIDDINMNFIFEKMDPAPNLLEFERQLDLMVDYCLQHRHELFFSFLDLHRIADSHDTDPASLDTGWCGAGAMPCLGVDGYIYPCFRFTTLSIPEGTERFSVGDVWNGLTQKERFTVLRESTRKKVSEPKCLECSCESGCGWCIAGAYMESGQLFRQTHICDTQKLQVKYAKKYWDEFQRLEGYRGYSKEAACACIV